MDTKGDTTILDYSSYEIQSKFLRGELALPINGESMEKNMENEMETGMSKLLKGFCIGDYNTGFRV